MSLNKGKGVPFLLLREKMCPWVGKDRDPGLREAVWFRKDGGPSVGGEMGHKGFNQPDRLEGSLECPSVHSRCWPCLAFPLFWDSANGHGPWSSQGLCAGLALTEQRMALRRKGQGKTEALKILQRPVMLRAWTWMAAEEMDRGYSDRTQDPDGLWGLSQEGLWGFQPRQLGFELKSKLLKEDIEHSLEAVYSSERSFNSGITKIIHLYDKSIYIKEHFEMQLNMFIEINCESYRLFSVW